VVSPSKLIPGKVENDASNMSVRSNVARVLDTATDISFNKDLGQMGGLEHGEWASSVGRHLNTDACCCFQ
jgi:hypothetical protein